MEEENVFELLQCYRRDYRALLGESGIVTRSLLVLQQHKTDEGQTEYAEFLHMLNRKLCSPLGTVTDNLQRWVIEVNGAPGTLYANEMYQLQIDFPECYPMETPQVQGTQIMEKGYKLCEKYKEHCYQGHLNGKAAWGFFSTCDKKDSIIDWMSKFSKKADNHAQGIREHVTLAPKISETVKGKLSMGARILQAGRIEKVFRRTILLCGEKREVTQGKPEVYLDRYCR